MKHVVFDIGAVLIHWDPVLAWVDDLGDTETRAFLQRINFDKLNLACDAGGSFSDAARALPDAEDRNRLSQYIDRYAQTVPNKISGTWDILYALKDAGVRVFAITNWSAETWPEGCRAHPELTEVFETTIVSGRVGMVKPSVALYRHFCAEAGVDAADCIFTDDGLHNCLGAKAAGMEAIHFRGAETLEADLKARGIL